MKLSYEEKISRIRLIRTDNIGPVTFWNIIKLFGSGLAAVDKVPELALRGGSKTKKLVSSAESAIAEYENTYKFGGRIIFREEPEFPALLKKIEDTPPFISVIGTLENKNPTIAIVGARAASLNAIKFTEKLSKELSERGFVIVSGFARGIDYAAHKTALSTITVFAGGIDVIYPPENEDLYKQIIEKGAVISDSPIGTKIQPTLFPKRNRIIAGVSKGIIIIEAAMKSGSLITANFATKYNRDLYAVPGFPEDPRCKGCNDLIKKGAILLTSAEDVINNTNLFNYSEDNANDEVSFFQAHELSEQDLTSARQEILKLIGSTPVSINDIVSVIGNTQVVLTVIVELELSDKIIRVGNNQVVMLYD